MIIVLLRIAACMVIIALPFVLLAFASGKADGLLWLIFPVVAAAPALLLLALVFAPVEALADARGLPRTQTVLIAGAIATSLVWLAFQFLSAWSQGKPVASILASGIGLRTLIIWIVLGVLLGAIWRGSEVLARWFGWISAG